VKVLIECATRNYEVYYKLCQFLHKKYPEAEFGYFTHVAENTVAKIKTLYESSENPILKILDPFAEENLIDNHNDNLNVIRSFENFSGMTIWKMIAADRYIGWNDHIGNYGTYIPKDLRNDREYLIAKVASEIRGISEIFNDFKPDILIPSRCMGATNVFILEQMCKSAGVRYLLPEISRVSNLWRISEDVMCLSPEIDKDYREMILKSDVTKLKRGNELYAAMNEDFSELGNFDSDYLHSYGLRTRENIIDSYLLWQGCLLERLIDFRDFLKSFIKSLYLNQNSILTPLHTFKLSLQLRSQSYANKKVSLDKSFGQLPSDEQKYLYFPLYNIPEYSSNFQSTMWLNIVSVVEALSKSIPGDWIIVLKEHPTGLEHNYRQKDFYDQLNRIPNVQFAPVLANGNNLVANAELVFVTVGTSGWEAILKGVPVLSPVECFWDCMGLSHRSSDIESLHEDIKKAVENNKRISASERETRLVTFLQALLDNSFSISDPEVFSYYYEGTQEQYYRQGQELANGLIDYIEKLKIDKNISNKKYFGSK